MKTKYYLGIIILLVFTGACHTTKLTTGKNSKVLRIITYNIRHGAPIHAADTDVDLKGIAAVINAQKPDLVALQEVDSLTQRAPMDEAKELGRLTGMNYHFFKAIDFQGGGYGVAILSRFPILNTRHDMLPMPDPSGEARTLGIVTIAPAKGVKFDFAVTHLELKKENRLAQVNRLVDISKENTLPLVVAGDFNAFPDSREIGILKTEYTFACDTNCPLTFPSDHPKITIDYIISNPAASKRFQVQKYEAIQHTQASDHLPLIEYVSFK